MKLLIQNMPIITQHIKNFINSNYFPMGVIQAYQILYSDSKLSRKLVMRIFREQKIHREWQFENFTRELFTLKKLANFPPAKIQSREIMSKTLKFNS